VRLREKSQNYLYHLFYIVYFCFCLLPFIELRSHDGVDKGNKKLFNKFIQKLNDNRFFNFSRIKKLKYCLNLFFLFYYPIINDRKNRIVELKL